MLTAEATGPLNRSGATPPARTLIDILRETAQRHPEASVLEDEAGALSYRELLALVWRTAARLHEHGVRRGDRVGVRMPSGDRELYIAILGVMAAGAAYVPVDADDPQEWIWSERSGGPDAHRLALGHHAQLAHEPQDLVLSDPGADRMFDDRVYKRGALALHALRLTVGDDAFFGILRAWTAAHRDGTAKTADFLRPVRGDGRTRGRGVAPGLAGRGGAAAAAQGGAGRHARAGQPVAAGRGSTTATLTTQPAGAGPAPTSIGSARPATRAMSDPGRTLPGISVTRTSPGGTRSPRPSAFSTASSRVHPRRSGGGCGAKRGARPSSRVSASPRSTSTPTEAASRACAAAATTVVPAYATLSATGAASGRGAPWSSPSHRAQRRPTRSSAPGARRPIGCPSSLPAARERSSA
ncbi:hypothetical protein ASD19_13115 [Microbacterium sp. Root53]|uniref:AMP-binding protein n=1 Tax=Microbacterium sp. Root53 TaxID=1736553 RepID=UPI0006F629A3|nr:hypothetical protein ASD19_13115 [Microbacterium sp. Root53]